MKKIIFMLMMVFFSLTISAQWNGNAYTEPQKQGAYVETPYRYVDGKGVDWGTVYINKENGRCKVSRMKDGKKVTKYLKEETCKEYCRKMNIAYTYVRKPRN